MIPLLLNEVQHQQQTLDVQARQLTAASEEQRNKYALQHISVLLRLEGQDA